MTSPEILGGVTGTCESPAASSKEGEAELRHRDFCVKVPKVLGEEMSEKFRASLKDAYGREQPGYRFPKREACLMAMSYSYDLQARWGAKTAPPSSPQHCQPQ
jgi:hypothetical protein